jgi:hypothetical protein
MEVAEFRTHDGPNRTAKMYDALTLSATAGVATIFILTPLSPAKSTHYQAFSSTSGKMEGGGGGGRNSSIRKYPSSSSSSH